MDNCNSQSEELLALRSIYEEKDLIIIDETPPRGRFMLNVPLGRPFFIICGNSRMKSREVQKYKIEYLPPIILYFEFPNTYPTDTGPAFLLSCSWLKPEELSKLCKKLDCMWQEGCGEVVLFKWISFLQDEVFNFLGILDFLDITELVSYSHHDIMKKNLTYKDETSEIRLKENSNSESNKPQKSSFMKGKVSSNEHTFSDRVSEKVQPTEKQTLSDTMQYHNIKPRVCGGPGRFDSRAFLDLTNGSVLLPLLQKFNKNRKIEVFKNEWFTCEICYLDKKGYEFIRFNKCEHIYCRDCVKNYFEIQIREGNVQSLNCPNGKCESQADICDVKALVSVELFQKYDALLLARTLECMSDIAYCPRQLCQSVVITDQSNNMGRCPECQFAFCLFCRMAYHGVAPCQLKNEERRKICDKYLQSNGDERLEMERRYGKKALKFLTETILSENWVSSYSKQCPHCHASIEKSEGCNKMTCYKCGTYFCWLCMAKLNASNPYTHFNQMSSPCFNQLFPEDEMTFQPGEFVQLY